MIATDKRKAIFLLHQEGMAVREIARRLGLSRNTVRAIIRQEGAHAAARCAATSSGSMKSCCAGFIKSAKAGWCACMKSWWRKKASR